GKAPAKLLEARLGRGAILEQVVNDALGREPGRERRMLGLASLETRGRGALGADGGNRVASGSALARCAGPALR
ncbi:hypothetical protein ABZW96_29195, partial [Nocardia sp. NPDC004168]|uniref:hypothetical protein n=1 Tax=Nocardia sp. NPDC004168 TaxID=3154452 RepID=UPI0033BBD6A7